MLIGNYPVATSIDDSDIIIISKDGVHLMQINATEAGLGSGAGLRWWKETETDIYREYVVVGADAALVKVNEGTANETMAYEFQKHYFCPDNMNVVAGYSNQPLQAGVIQPPKDAKGNTAWFKPNGEEDKDDCWPWDILTANSYFVAGNSVSPECCKATDQPMIAVAGVKVYSQDGIYFTQHAPGQIWCSEPGVYTAGYANTPFNESWGFTYGNNSLLYQASKWGEGLNFPSYEDQSQYYQDYTEDETEASLDAWPPSVGPCYGNSAGSGNSSGYICGFRGSKEFKDFFDAVAATGESDWKHSSAGIYSISGAISGYISDNVPTLGDKIGDIISATTDDPSAAIFGLCNLFGVAYNNCTDHPETNWDSYTVDTAIGDVYEVKIHLYSPFAYATWHWEPFYAIAGGMGEIPSFPLKKVSDYTRDNEDGYPITQKYPFYNYWKNEINDGDYGPLSSALSSHINHRNPFNFNGENVYYKTKLTDNDVTGTGPFFVHVCDGWQAEIKDGMSVYDFSLFPSGRFEFDNDEGWRSCIDGDPVQTNFTVTDYDGIVHPLFGDGATNDGWTYCGPRTSGGSTYGIYRGCYNPPDPEHGIDTPTGMGAMFAGKTKSQDDWSIKFYDDWELGNHWIWDKDFLEEILNEKVVKHRFDYTQTVRYHQGISTETPVVKTATVRHHVIEVYKGFTTKANVYAGERILKRFRDLGNRFIKTSGLKAFAPVTSDGADAVTTSIGVQEEEGFWTGYTHYNTDEEVAEGKPEKEKVKKIYIDTETGTVNTKGTYQINDKNIDDILQKKLIEGPGIELKSNADGTETISSTAVQEAIEDFAEAIVESTVAPGIISTYDGENDEVELQLLHEVTGGTASGTKVPCKVTRSTGSSGHGIKDTIQVDKSDLGIPTIQVGHGLQDIGSPALHQHILESKALDNIKVNGVKATRTYDGTQDGDGWYVDLDISGGGGKDTTIYTPVPDYNNRSLITTLTQSQDEYTATADGVLYFNCHWVASTTSATINIGGVIFEIGTTQYGNERSDGASMLPLAKGQKAKLVSYTGDISTSESVVGGRFYFIPYLAREDTDTAFVSANIDYSVSSTSIAPQSLPVVTLNAYDPEGTYYTFEPTSDGVLIPANGNPNVNEGHIKIFPLEEDGTCIDPYYFSYVTNGYAHYESFPVRKGRTYKIGRTSSNKMAYLQFKPFVTSQDSNIWAPLLDYANAEELSLIDGASGLKTIPEPAITDRPGILIDKCYSSSDLQFKPSVVVSNGNWNLTHAGTNTLHSYIQVPAYTARPWYYTLESGHTGTPKVVFIPFKKLVIPGVDYIVENGNSLVNNGVCDLTSLFNRVAALEAEVFPT